MELTWLADTPQSRRRTRALRACAHCQRRKKRCRHLSTGTSAEQAEPVVSGDVGRIGLGLSSNHQPANSAQFDDVSTNSMPVTSAPSESSRPDRFVGDLNPEAVIREKLNGDSSNRFRNQIGLWVSAQSIEGPKDNALLDDADTTVIGNSTQQSQATSSVSSLLQQRFTSALNACQRLPRLTRDRLITLYFSRVHHILPLVNKDSFLAAYADGSASLFLERAICLVAAKDQAASAFLRTAADGPLKTPRQFCSEIYKGLVVVMDAGLETDRVTRIRILALMSLHCEGYEGAEAASMHLCQAVHQAQTGGLHLEQPDRNSSDSLSKLFWCLWTLDKMHASIGGRPVIVADRDIGLRKPHVKGADRRSAFDIWFVISDLLATVISFYRPSADNTTGWESDFPTFEEIIGDNVEEGLDFTTLGILELYYHAVGILSCRSRLADRPHGSNSSVRQGLAAVRIYSIVATECLQNLPPLPIVPYALSLSMGVSYQQFRSSRLITHFNRAKASLEACCSVLDSLGTYWCSAEAMARLGRKALHQIEEARPRYQQDLRQPSEPGNNIIASDSSINGPTVEQGTNNNDSLQTSDNIVPRVPVRKLSPQAPEELQQAERLEHNAFEDIDMLFGDFLDLSLPTNFWDPLFLSEDEQTRT